ncbi:hypothetical protein EPYR_03964 [Erwinia pyrifoliae DSM 12163]|nr:hypothetical protein EPYR_03964 [Erwinia pyrifoliae DSM 12163]
MATVVKISARLFSTSLKAMISVMSAATSWINCWLATAAIPLNLPLAYRKLRCAGFSVWLVDACKPIQADQLQPQG